MTVAQGIVKQTIIKKQSALGTPATGSGGQILRRNNSTFQLDRDTFESDEIVSHQQHTGIGYGQVKTTGKIAGLLSASTYSLLFANLLRADFAAVSAITTLSLTIAGAGPYTVTRGTGDFLTGGIKAGDVVRLTGGSLDAANVAINLLVISLTAAALTVTTLNGAALTTEGPIASCTVTVTGKKCAAPLTAHTNDFYTVEEWYSDISKSETFTDAKVAKADIGLPSTGNATVGFDWLGLGRTRGTSQVLTTPTSETTTSVLTAVNGVVYVNGSAVGNSTGASLSIDGSLKHGEAIIGSNYAIDIDRGKIKVSGQFTGLFDSTTIQAFYDAETPVSFVFIITDTDEADSAFVTFTMGRVKITGDAPDDGEKMIMRTYPFVAELNGDGGAALAWDKTILTIQDSQAV